MAKDKLCDFNRKELSEKLKYLFCKTRALEYLVDDGPDGPIKDAFIKSISGAYEGDFVSPTNHSSQLRLEATLVDDSVTPSVYIDVEGIPATSIDNVYQDGDNAKNYFALRTDITGFSDKIDKKVDKVSGKGLSTNDLTNELKEKYDEAHDHGIKSAVVQSNKEQVSILFTREDGTTFSVPFADKNIVTAEEDVHIANLSFQKDTGLLIVTVKSWDKEKKVSKLEETIRVSIDGRYAPVAHKHKLGDISGLEGDVTTMIEAAQKATAIANKALDTAKEISGKAESALKATTTLATNKVDKVSGKGLSTNDLTNELKTKIEGAGKKISKIELTDTDAGDSILVITYSDKSTQKFPWPDSSIDGNAVKAIVKKFKIGRSTKDTSIFEPILVEDFTETVEGIDLYQDFARKTHKHVMADVTGLEDDLKGIKASVSKVSADASTAKMAILKNKDTVTIDSETVKKFYKGKNILDDTNFYAMTFLQTSTTSTTFKVTSPYALITVDGTSKLTGKGSTAAVTVVGNDVYLKIANK